MSKRRRSPRPIPSHTVSRPLSYEDVLDEVEVLTRRIREDNQKRDELVRKARDLGASWHAVSLAVEMTPQGANRRWREP